MSTPAERSEAVLGTPEPIYKVVTVEVKLGDEIFPIIADVEDLIKAFAVLTVVQMKDDVSVLDRAEVLSISYTPYSP